MLAACWCHRPSFHSHFGKNYTQLVHRSSCLMSAGAAPSADGASLAQHTGASSASVLQYAGHASVRLCKPSFEVNSWHLADCVTMERTPLPPPVGEWMLEVDTDNFGAVVDSQTGQVVFLEDFLRRSVLLGNNGERYIMDRKPDGSSSAFSLCDKQILHRCLKIKFG